MDVEFDENGDIIDEIIENNTENTPEISENNVINVENEDISQILDDNIQNEE